VAAASSLIVAFLFCCIPIIRRKAATRGAVTGVVQTGLYKIVHHNHLNSVSAPNADFANPITGLTYKRIADQKWDIVRQDNQKYQIKNHAHRIFAGWQHAHPIVGEDVINLREDRDLEILQWSIEETKPGSRMYRIKTTDTSNTDLYWSLTDTTPSTPISLVRGHEDPNCLWTFCLIEDHSV